MFWLQHRAWMADLLNYWLVIAETQGLNEGKGRCRDKDIPGVELPGPGLRPVVEDENKGRVKSVASRLRNGSQEKKNSLQVKLSFQN